MIVPFHVRLLLGRAILRPAWLHLVTTLVWWTGRSGTVFRIPGEHNVALVITFESSKEPATI
jgi:hypothetical protein